MLTLLLQPLVSQRRSLVGGTTVAGTMAIAQMAGIKVFGTGGIGGVHPGIEKYLDVSADLTELGRTNVAVISSGAKSFLDLPKTVEYLETEGVYVATFRDKDYGANDTVMFPAFFARSFGDLKAPSVVENPAEAAGIICWFPFGNSAADWGFYTMRNVRLMG